MNKDKYMAENDVISKEHTSPGKTPTPSETSETNPYAATRRHTPEQRSP
jgi:hypothetical protein